MIGVRSEGRCSFPDTWVRIVKSSFELLSKLRNGDIIVLFMDVEFGLYKGSSFQKREEEMFLL